MLNTEKSGHRVSQKMQMELRSFEKRLGVTPEPFKPRNSHGSSSIFIDFHRFSWILHRLSSILLDFHRSSLVSGDVGAILATSWTEGCGR